MEATDDKAVTMTENTIQKMDILLTLSYELETLTDEKRKTFFGNTPSTEENMLTAESSVGFEAKINIAIDTIHSRINYTKDFLQRL